METDGTVKRRKKQGGNKSKTLSPLDSNSNNWVQEYKVYGGIFRWKS